jgi:hypothetical protein
MPIKIPIVTLSFVQLLFVASNVVFWFVQVLNSDRGTANQKQTCLPPTTMRFHLPSLVVKHLSCDLPMFTCAFEGPDTEDHALTLELLFSIAPSCPSLVALAMWSL